MKYAFLEQHRPDYRLSIERFCRLLSICQWLLSVAQATHILREQANNVLDEIISMLFEKHKHRYGYRRIYKVLVTSYDYKG